LSNNAPKSSLTRIVVPVAAALVGLLVVLSLMQPGDKPAEDGTAQTNTPQQAQGENASTPPAPATAPAPADADAADTDPDSNADAPVANTDTDTTDADAVADADADADTTATDTEPEAPAPAVAGPLDNLRPAFADAPPHEAGVEPTVYAIGSATPDSGYELLAEINPYRACIHRLTLANTANHANSDERYVIQQPLDLSPATAPGSARTIGSYAAEYITINDQRVKLWEKDASTEQWLGHWQLDSQSDDSVTLSLTIVGGPTDAAVPVARITRTYSIAQGSHSVSLVQRITNLLDATVVAEPMTVRWQQLAQTDIYHEPNDYLRGRSQHYVTGYFRDEYDPSHLAVYRDGGFITRPDLIKYLNNGDWNSIWPNEDVIDENDEEPVSLAWLASENRFFVAITSARTAPDTVETGDVTPLQAIYPTINTSVWPDAKTNPDLKEDERAVLLGLASQELTLAPGTNGQPGQSTAIDALSLDLYAGPREDAIFSTAPYKALRFDQTIRYSLGGFCGVCTFQWLAHLLLGLLHLLHSVTADWGVAIIILVLFVRLCLHPLTKRGQISMMKMGKQMAAVQPELNKLKKKYADEPAEMQKAQMQLFREKGINPASGMLGCLPMFLQMPIWIALYAMLYYAVELRHEPALYGLFQQFAGWEFLADLSSADRFIPLFENDGQHIFNLWLIQLDYSSINVLPILMGVTFYFNMKYTTPPAMNEQQASQQKIMKFMPLLFPFFLYSAPAGLTLYICASTFAGIIDSRIVRKHVKELEESGDLFKPKERKSGGFMDKMHKIMEAKQQQMQDMKNQPQNKGPQNYKKRRKK